MVSGCGRTQQVLPPESPAVENLNLGGANRGGTSNSATIQVGVLPLFVAKKVDGLNVYYFDLLVEVPQNANARVVAIRSVTMKPAQGPAVELKGLPTGPLTFEAFRAEPLSDEIIDTWKTQYGLKPDGATELKRLKGNLVDVSLRPAKIIPAGATTFDVAIVLSNGYAGTVSLTLKLEKDAPYEAGR